MTDQVEHEATARPDSLPWMRHDMETATIVTRKKPGLFIACSLSALSTIEQDIAHADYIILAANAHATMLAALEVAEWIGAGGSCPLCFRFMSKGHTNKCQLAAAIAAGRGALDLWQAK